MIKLRSVVFIILMSLLFQFVPARVVIAEPTTEFFAAPSQIMSGGEVMFSGLGFTPDSSVDLYLQTVPSQYIGSLATSSTGQFSGAFPLPVVDPGIYDVMAAPNDVTTSLTVIPGMSIDLQPNSGPPGTITHFTVSNLLAGQLRLDYDGIPVFGPVDVQAGVFEGDFQIPADRPISFPQDVALTAFNLIGNQVMGSILTFFLAESPLPVTYEIQVNDYPQDPVSPGYPFTLQGTITPPPLGQLNLFDLKVLWKSGSGQIVPITVGTPQLFSDGSFSITGKAPSLLGGDPLLPSAESGGQVGVVLINKQNGTNTNLQVVPWLDPPHPVFKVKVVDENSNPIQGAIVDVRAFFDIPGKELGGETNTGSVMKNQLDNLGTHPNQITSFIGQTSTSESDPFTCETTNTYGRTNSDGIFEVKIDPEMLAMMGKKIFLGNLPEPTYTEVPLEFVFPLYVNATFQGFGNNGLPEPYELDIRFSGLTHLFYNAITNQSLNTNPLVVSLKSLPAGTKIKAPIVPKLKPHLLTIDAAPVVGGFKNYVGTGIPMIAFGNFYSFPVSQFPNALFSGDGAIDVEFQYDPALFGALDESKAKFTIEGQVYPFVNKGKKLGQAGCEALVYKATVPQEKMIRMLPGSHTGLIEISDLAVVPNITKYFVQLNFVPAPTWILDDKYKVRSIFIYGGTVSMIGYQFPVGDPESNSNLDTNVPKIGPMENNVNFNDAVRQFLYPDHTTGITYDGEVNSSVLDESVWPPTKYKSNVAGGVEIIIPEKTITVLDTGKIPLYRHVMGIPPIAGATLGADMWFDATLTTSGLIKFLPGGGTSTNMLVFPKATVGVDAFIDLSVLFGLISANAHALPNIGLGMPVYFVNGNLADSKKCFLYKLDISWSAKAGICPFCLKKSGVEPIFNGSNPDPCSVPTTANVLLDQKLVTVESPPPPAASPALAVDGFGHTLIVWSDENNNIQSTLRSGGQKVGDFQVSSSMGGIDPQVAFYAPNKAVAVWTESSLASAAESEAATLEQIIQAQYLKYSLWNGSGWSVPENLTLPADSNGEGKVVLAGCINTQAGCSANGEVTAVWVRNAVANMTDRQFHLYYSVFNGVNWGSVTAVDPSSNGTDTESSVAYSNSGTADVVWVRDADRDLSTVDDRQIYHRKLSGVSPVNVVNDLPSAAVEPSLIFNPSGEMIVAFTVATDPQALVGNQRQLHAAKQTCGETGCTWSYAGLIDANGRPIHAETPSVTLNANGQAQITYRAVGFGAAYPGGPTVMSGDPLGTILGTGEIAQAFVSFSGNIAIMISPSYQNHGGKTVWQPKAVFDTLFNQTYAVSSIGSTPVYSQQMMESLELMGYDSSALDGTSSPLAFSVSGDFADFSVSSVSLNTTFLQDSNNLLTVLVAISNNGPLFASDVDSGQLEIVLTWDAPAGSGEYAGSFVIPIPIEAGGSVLAEFSIADDSLILPAAANLPHVLYVQVNQNQLIPESNFENNTWSSLIGGLPVPQGLTGVAQPGDSSVFLNWEPVENDAVVGYRVYRSSDGRFFEPVGSSFGYGFVDLTAVIGQSYQYKLASYSADGFESELSDPIQVVIENFYSIFLPLTMR